MAPEEQMDAKSAVAGTGTLRIETSGGVFDLPRGPLLGEDQVPWQRSQQQWGDWEMGTLYFGTTANIAAIMVGGAAILAGVNFWQLLIGGSIGVAVTAALLSLNGLAGSKYGLPHTIAMRAAFGNRVGTWLASLVRASVATIWFSIQSWLAAVALNSIVLTIVPAWGNLDNFLRLVILYLAFYLLQYLFTRQGYHGIRIIEVYGAPVIVISLIMTVVWGRIIAGTWGPVFEAGTKYSAGAPTETFIMAGVVASIAGWMTLVVNVSDVSRAAVSYRVNVVWAFIGMWLGWMMSIILGAALLSMAEAMGQGPKFIPVDWLGFFPNPVFAVVVLTLLVSLALTTNPTGNLFSMATTLANIFPRRLNFVSASNITMFISIFLVPWVLLENSDTYLAFIIQYGSVLSAIAGIMIADLWVIRRQVLPLPDLYELNGRFRYWAGGINWVAVVTFFIAAGIAWFNPTWSALLSLALSFFLYIILMYVGKMFFKEVQDAMPEEGGYPSVHLEAGS